jgi:ketosteroid isomerase-like protein
MTWEITGRSAVSKKYANTQQFLDEVLHPFGARFTPATRSARQHPAIYDDEDNSTVVVVWDGRGTTTAGTPTTTPTPGS